MFNYPRANATCPYCADTSCYRCTKSVIARPNPPIVNTHAHFDVIAAWLLDRSHKYPEDSCCRASIEALAKEASNNEIVKAQEHGELDDLLKDKT